MSESSYRPPVIHGSSSGYFGHQGSSNAYFSAMPESSYRPPVLQGSPGGYSGHQGQTSGQQSTALRGCYKCEDPSQQPMISVPVEVRGASVLFDPRSTYLYVSSLFAHFLDIPHEFLGTHVYMSTPVGDSVVVDWIYRSCVVTFCGYETRSDLLLLDMTDFEVIMGMDWLSPYHVILDCHVKIVT
ncbi:uncharacterized protein [Nicotiana tomentosiformis]|uniref:uncharacterized protein n=1 Tax=Nicotiana tomentosiformis TaxID=4098 RepID=UPI00388C6EF1